MTLLLPDLDFTVALVLLEFLYTDDVYTRLLPNERLVRDVMAAAVVSSKILLKIFSFVHIFFYWRQFRDRYLLIGTLECFHPIYFFFGAFFIV